MNDRTSDVAGAPRAAGDEAVVTLDALRRAPLLAGCDDAALERVRREAEEITLADGALLFRDDDIAQDVWIVLDGTLVVATTSEDGVESIVDRLGTTDHIGEISLLTRAVSRHHARALGATRLLRIPGEAFRALVRSCEPAMTAVFRSMPDRLRRLEPRPRQRERMAALGTMAAGLAHELKNPAAATIRTTDLLREQLAALAPLGHELAERTWSAGELGLLRQLESATSEIDQRTREIDAIERSDREDAVRGWLERHDIERAWNLAPLLVDRGVRPEALDAITRGCDLEHVARALAWAGRLALTRQLLDELRQGTARIIEIVMAVKAYSYIDPTTPRTTDIHEAIEQSLTILGHKLRASRANVVRAYDRSLPPVTVYGTELHQVLTNLLDNAADAVAPTGGTVRATTRRDGDALLVEIEDDGSGIAPELVSRVFDQFFTTKGAGKGTGLGLDIAREIVERHGGSIAVRSRPGDTRFTVRLPLTMDATNRANPETT